MTKVKDIVLGILDLASFLTLLSSNDPHHQGIDRARAMAARLAGMTAALPTRQDDQEVQG